MNVMRRMEKLLSGVLKLSKLAFQLRLKWYWIMIFWRLSKTILFIDLQIVIQVAVYHI